MTNLQRLEEIFQSEIFETYFKLRPDMRCEWKKKVFPIAGDLTLSGLGLSEESRQTLMDEVQVMINCAASVNFDDPLLEALNINYFGSLRMLDLA